MEIKNLNNLPKFKEQRKSVSDSLTQLEKMDIDSNSSVYSQLK